MSDDNPLRLWWTVSAMLVLLMQVGFICLEMGCVRAQSRPGIAIKNFAMLAVSSISFTLFGACLMFGDSLQGLVGFGLPELVLDSHAWLCFQVGFAAVAATIISGALAGRTTLASNVILALVMAMVVYPVFGHWMWNDGGWLKAAGAHDFAGSGVVHFVGGFTALLAARVAGRRRIIASEAGKSGASGTVSLPFVSVGVIFLWVGWIGFNGGSYVPDQLLTAEGMTLRPVGSAVLATCVASSSGAIAALLIAGFYLWKRGPGRGLSLGEAFRQRLLFAPVATLSGAMGGMVAVTANCDWLLPELGSRFLPGAVLIGVVGGLASFFTARLVSELMRVDDPVEAVGVHAGAGAAGLLMASLSEQVTLGAQLLALAAAAIWVAVSVTPVLLLLKSRDLLRCSPAEEELGLTFEPFEAPVITREMIAERRLQDSAEREPSRS